MGCTASAVAAEGNSPLDLQNAAKETEFPQRRLYQLKEVLEGSQMGDDTSQADQASINTFPLLNDVLDKATQGASSTQRDSNSKSGSRPGSKTSNKSASSKHSAKSLPSNDNLAKSPSKSVSSRQSKASKCSSSKSQSSKNNFISKSLSLRSNSLRSNSAKSVGSNKSNCSVTSNGNSQKTKSLRTPTPDGKRSYNGIDIEPIDGCEKINFSSIPDIDSINEASRSNSASRNVIDLLPNEANSPEVAVESENQDRNYDSVTGYEAVQNEIDNAAELESSKEITDDEQLKVECSENDNKSVDPSVENDHIQLDDNQLLQETENENAVKMANENSPTTDEQLAKEGSIQSANNEEDADAFKRPVDDSFLGSNSVQKEGTEIEKNVSIHGNETSCDLENTPNSENDSSSIEKIWKELDGAKEPSVGCNSAAISISDLLSDSDSIDDQPCSLAASSSGLVIPRPVTSKRKEKYARYRENGPESTNESDLPLVDSNIDSNIIVNNQSPNEDLEDDKNLNLEQESKPIEDLSGEIQREESVTTEDNLASLSSQDPNNLPPISNSPSQNDAGEVSNTDKESRISSPTLDMSIQEEPNPTLLPENVTINNSETTEAKEEEECKYQNDNSLEINIEAASNMMGSDKPIDTDNSLPLEQENITPDNPEICMQKELDSQSNSSFNPKNENISSETIEDFNKADESQLSMKINHEEETGSSENIDTLKQSEDESLLNSYVNQGEEKISLENVENSFQIENKNLLLTRTINLKEKNISTDNAENSVPVESESQINTSINQVEENVSSESFENSIQSEDGSQIKTAINQVEESESTENIEDSNQIEDASQFNVNMHENYNEKVGENIPKNQEMPPVDSIEENRLKTNENSNMKDAIVFPESNQEISSAVNDQNPSIIHINEESNETFSDSLPEENQQKLDNEDPSGGITKENDLNVTENPKQNSKSVVFVEEVRVIGENNENYSALLTTGNEQIKSNVAAGNEENEDSKENNENNIFNSTDVGKEAGELLQNDNQFENKNTTSSDKTDPTIAASEHPENAAQDELKESEDEKINMELTLKENEAENENLELPLKDDEVENKNTELTLKKAENNKINSRNHDSVSIKVTEISSLNNMSIKHVGRILSSQRSTSSLEGEESGRNSVQAHAAVIGC